MAVGIIYNDLDKNYYKDALAVCESLEKDLRELYYGGFNVAEPKTSSYEEGMYTRKRVNEFFVRFGQHTSIDLELDSFSEVETRKSIALLQVLGRAIKKEAYKGPSFEIVLAFPNEEIKKLRMEE